MSNSTGRLYLIQSGRSGRQTLGETYVVAPLLLAKNLSVHSGSAALQSPDRTNAACTSSYFPRCYSFSCYCCATARSDASDCLPCLLVLLGSVACHISPLRYHSTNPLGSSSLPCLLPHWQTANQLRNGNFNSILGGSFVPFGVFCSHSFLRHSRPLSLETILPYVLFVH